MKTQPKTLTRLKTEHEEKRKTAQVSVETEERKTVAWSKFVIKVCLVIGITISAWIILIGYFF